MAQFKNFLGGLVLLAAAPGAQAWGFPSAAGAGARVPMDQIDVLTFSQGRHTNGRRVSPVLQLSCVGGDARGEAARQVHAVQCRKTGSSHGASGRVPQWKCEADLPVEYRLGETTVSCEGYEHSADPFVLEGSCGLEFTLHRTGRGSHRGHGAADQLYGASHGGGGSFFTTAMLAVAAGCMGGGEWVAWGLAAWWAATWAGPWLLALAALCWLCSSSGGRAHSGRDSGGGRAHGDSGYTHGDGSGYGRGYRRGRHYGGGGGGGGGSTSSFLGGMATGAAASSMFSSRRPQSSGSGFFGSGSSSSSSYSSSGARHTSSGFGGTRNR
jgi:hypothetical protein